MVETGPVDNNKKSSGTVGGTQYPGSIRRGDIYSARLNESAGDARKCIRPVLIIQNNTGNEFSSTLIVACITSSLSTRPYPVNVSVPDRLLQKKGVVRLNRILTLDRKQLGEKIAKMPPEAMKQVDEALRVSIGLPRYD
ncbi:MAG: type II toxin-antitoxin system PemK/MazF family toxin [Thermoleophilia bacterium]